MRLGNVVESSSRAEGQGEQQGVVRNNKSQRSSLDFKAKSYQANGSPITTKPGKRKNRQQQQQYEEEQIKQQQQQSRRSYLSRARGHSGPPPRKWELADLQNMNEEELLQALYADPELAKEAARMAEKIAAEKGGPPTGTPSRRPTATPRGKRGSAAGRHGPGEYPDHMRELMDGGVPVMQWLIVLVLLGAAFFQLRKIISLPDTKDPSKRRPRGKGEPKIVAKKAKASSNLASLEKVALAIDADILELENVKGAAAKAANNKKVTTAAAKKQQKVKKEKGSTKSNPTATKANNAKQYDAADDDSVGSDDDAILPATAPVKVALSSARVPVKAPLPTLTAKTTTKDDGNGWQVVSKTTRTVSELNEAEYSAPQGVEASPSVAEGQENTPSATTASNGKNDPRGKTKKKQKKNKGKGVDDKNTNPSLSTSAFAGMENDAALAQELQNEEDNMAEKSTTSNNNTATTSDISNTWEEVSTRKRKGTKPESATN